MHHAPCEPAYSERVSLSFCVSRAPTTHCHADIRKAYQAGILLQHQIISFRNGKLNNRRVAALKKFGLVFPPVSLQATKPAKVPGCVFASLQHRLEESPGTAAAGALNKTQTRAAAAVEESHAEGNLFVQLICIDHFQKR
jgi:hypothetical protein